MELRIDVMRDMARMVHKVCLRAQVEGLEVQKVFEIEDRHSDYERHKIIEEEIRQLTISLADTILQTASRSTLKH